MHAGKSGESTPAATKGRRRLGHRLTLCVSLQTTHSPLAHAMPDAALLPLLPRWNSHEAIEQIRGDPLDARVSDGGVIQSPAPADRPCSENPGTARCLVNRRV